MRNEFGPELVCECGASTHSPSGEVKHEREALIVDFKSFEPDAAAIIPRYLQKLWKKGWRYHLYKPLPNPNHM